MIYLNKQDIICTNIYCYNCFKEKLLKKKATLDTISKVAYKN